MDSPKDQNVLEGLSRLFGESNAKDTADTCYWGVQADHAVESLEHNPGLGAKFYEKVYVDKLREMLNTNDTPTKSFVGQMLTTCYLLRHLRSVVRVMYASKVEVPEFSESIATFSINSMLAVANAYQALVDNTHLMYICKGNDAGLFRTGIQDRMIEVINHLPHAGTKELKSFPTKRAALYSVFAQISTEMGMAQELTGERTLEAIITKLEEIVL